VSGRYTSASEVIREALRLMDERDRLLEAKLDQLRQDIREGLDSGPSPGDFGAGAPGGVSRGSPGGFLADRWRPFWRMNRED